MGAFYQSIVDALNEHQREAVLHVNGPLLILAGAGSGKTRVLTSRIAYLVLDQGFHLNEILAMTFSNKAAREMHDRIKVFLNDQSSMRYPWISTFHSVGVRLLRRYGDKVNLDPAFMIYDVNDQLDVLKTVLKDLGVEQKETSPKVIHSRISKWKNEAIFPEKLDSAFRSEVEEIAAEAYKRYQDALRKANALDFDDLLLETHRLLKAEPDIKERLQTQWQHILVDEFQDTNRLQYLILKDLVNAEQNVCVVGDDDQSIYGWRGAKVENILKFDQSFKGCQVVRLEQNYRSSSNILKAASEVISKNELRHAKTLWTDQGEGEKIRMAILSDDRAEARFIISEIKVLLSQYNISPTEIAVLYRVNALSRNFEEECLRQRLPYKIIGGFRFYERKEIKDILAYVKLLLNAADLVSFRRVVNSPARGVGKTSVSRLIEAAGDEAIVNYLLQNRQTLPLKGKAKKGIDGFIEYLNWGAENLTNENISLVDLFVGAIEKTGYLQALQAEKTEESRDRQSNLQELLSAVQEFEEGWSPKPESENTELSELVQKLFDFYEQIALVSDTDQLDGREEEQVTFMSLHAAKGLEFDACFMAGMEEGLFPSARAFDSPDDLEEERRLCYVGITRAKKKLYLTRAERRRSFGSINFQMASRFLKEIPQNLIETTVDQSEKAFDDDIESYSFRPSFRKKSKTNEFSQVSPYEDEFSQEIYEFRYSRGEKVRHPSFGQGIVRQVELLGEDECLTIDFESKGRKRVLSQFVKKPA